MIPFSIYGVCPRTTQRCEAETFVRRRVVSTGVCAGVVILASFACSEKMAPVATTPPSPASTAGASAAPAGWVRFVVKTREPVETDDLTRELEGVLGPGVRVERLFESVDTEYDPDGMARMFRSAIPGRYLPSGHPWDSAYSLKEKLNLEQVEPDLERTLQQEPEASRLCLVDDPPPVDKGWSLANIRADQAWNLIPPGAGNQFGEGVSVCHPDTGWAEHIELDGSRLDLERARNLLDSGPSDGRDPLDYEQLLSNPGHGTGTGSVIVSEHQRGVVRGVAPRATLVPIRTAKSVVQVFDSDLARAVNYSVDTGCDVISMSLGGRSFFGLKAAVRRAVRNNLIVVAAAGNCVGFVVAPAAYEDCIAVAGSNIRDEPWKGSSGGRAVDISAPGEYVWTAERRRSDAPTTDITAGQGTSYAVANVAGAAALWLAFHNRDALTGRYRSVIPLQEVFRAVLRRTARVTDTWDQERFGSGILDVEALLRAELPLLESAALPAHTGHSELQLLARVLNRSPDDVRVLMAALFSTSLAEIDDRLNRWGPEITQLALADPVRFGSLLQTLATKEKRATEETAPLDPLPAASAHLRTQLAK